MKTHSILSYAGKEESISITVHSQSMEAKSSSVSSVSVQHIHMSGSADEVDAGEADSCEDEGTGVHIETSVTGMYANA